MVLFHNTYSLIIYSLLYLDTLCTHKVTSKLSVIDILHLQVTETQLRLLSYAVSSSGTIYNDLYFKYIDCLMSSGKHESLFHAVKETAKTDLYETDLPDTSHSEKVYMDNNYT